MSDNSISPPPPPPAGPPPVPPDADLPHDSLKPNIIISSSICWFVAAFFVALRFYTRGVIIRVLGWSDWSILVALVFAGATCGAVIEQATHGAGQHIWDLDPNDTPSAIAWGRAAWYGILFYLLSLCFSKTAILLLYIHIFTFKWARTAGQVLLAIVVITNIYMVLVTFTACIPLQAYWDFTLPKTYCHPQRFWWSNTGLHMVTDFLIFLLPMPVVWTIKLPRRQKIILSAVFGFGFLVCFISILRLLQLIRVQSDPDFTYAAAELSYMTAVEVNGAIVCACVMTLKPLLATFFPRLFLSSSSSSSSSYPASSASRRHHHHHHRRHYRSNTNTTTSDGAGGGDRSGGDGSTRRGSWRWWGGRARGTKRNSAGSGDKSLVGGAGGARGPPTIGSRPSKPPLIGAGKGGYAYRYGYGVDLGEDFDGEGDLDVLFIEGGGGGGLKRAAGVRGGGWLDISEGKERKEEQDDWRVDVELAESVGGGMDRRGLREGRGMPQQGGVRIDTEIKVEISQADGR